MFVVVDVAVVVAFFSTPRKSDGGDEGRRGKQSICQDVTTALRGKMQRVGWRESFAPSTFGMLYASRYVLCRVNTCY